MLPHSLRFKRFLFISVGLTLLAACSNEGQQQGAAPPPAPVDVVEVASQSLELTTELPGRTIAYRTAEIRPRISGIVEELLFQEGSVVERGDPLYQIEDSSYQAALSAARAEVQRAEAAFEIAELRYNRLEPLLERESVSQQEFDESAAGLSQSRANLAAAEAQLETARINLEYTSISAPISGRVGISQVTEGALVTALQAQRLVTIQQMDPMDVEINRSAEEVLRLRRQLANGDLVDTESSRVHLILEDGSTYEHQGELRFSEVSVNPSTGTVTLRASFPNPDHLLLPGMFVNTELVEAVQREAILIPQQAVMRDPSGNAFVWLVNDSNQVETRPIVTGRAIDNRWLVESGLSVGERVVLAGFQRIQPGVPVSPNPVGSQ